MRTKRLSLIGIICMACMTVFLVNSHVSAAPFTDPIETFTISPVDTGATTITDLTPGKKYAVAIIDGPGITIWEEGELTLTCQVNILMVNMLKE